MALICPVCNGIEQVVKPCPTCREAMDEAGSLSQFLDPYSPYLSAHEGDIGDDYNTCTHLFFCENCDTDKRVEVSKVKW
ncbi:hypothetical protein PRVXH_000854 [Proteinivorax hydrogeniformans]|uniref:Uncharacterized protein n=1 Tax=Proteinivorax hydrogeniformans TaxID=1826727 RepID=A0AAU8HVY5_9FIRM